MEACPTEVIGRANVLYSNSFCGFQAPRGEGIVLKDHFGVCYYYDETLETNLAEIKEESGCETLSCCDWIGSDYLRLHWSEHAKIPALLNTLLKKGYDFTPLTKAEAFFSPSIDKEFSFEAMEKKAIVQVQELLRIGLTTIVNHAFCEEWNYLTEEGKAFARSLREGQMYGRYNKERENFYEWGMFQNYDKATLLNNELTDDEKTESIDFEEDRSIKQEPYAELHLPCW